MLAGRVLISVTFRPEALLITALLVGAAAGSGPFRATAEHGDRDVRSLPGNRPIRWAYYYPPDPASLESLRANISRLDVVAPHWLTIDGMGHVRADERPDALALLVTVETLVLPSVALASREAGARIVSDPIVGAIAIEQLLAAAEPWDGLALDFEGLDPAARTGLTDFIGALGAALHTAGKYYAVALPAKTADARTGWSGAYDYAAIADAADWYLVMAYGFRTSASARPGSTAPFPWVDAALAYATSEIPPERLILGVAFYGYDWNLTAGPPARALRYADARQLMDRTGVAPFLDPQTMSVTFRYELDGEHHEVWFEDQLALAAKLRLVTTYGLAGAGAWRLGQEDPSAWSAWDRILSVGTLDPRR